MPRPFKNRLVNGQPTSVVYKPAGIPARELEWSCLTLDEFESLRLLDHLGQTQEQAAENMGVSRPTVTRIYASARKKISDAIVLGQAIRIDGGPIIESSFQNQIISRRGRGCGGGRRNRHGNNHNSVEQTMKVAVCAQ